MRVVPSPRLSGAVRDDDLPEQLAGRDLDGDRDTGRERGELGVGDAGGLARGQRYGEGEAIRSPAATATAKRQVVRSAPHAGGNAVPSRARSADSSTRRPPVPGDVAIGVEGVGLVVPADLGGVPQLHAQGAILDAVDAVEVEDPRTAPYSYSDQLEAAVRPQQADPGVRLEVGDGAQDQGVVRVVQRSAAVATASHTGRVGSTKSVAYWRTWLNSWAT